MPKFIVSPNLVFACGKHREDIAKRLCLVDGIDLNFVSDDNDPYATGTALHCSVLFDNLACVKLLISHGAKVRQEDILGCRRSWRNLEVLQSLLEVCQPSRDLRLDVEPDRWSPEYVASSGMLRLEETLERAANRPLSLQQQCRNSIREVLSLRSPGSSVWPHLERLELESALPECLVDFLLVFPPTDWRWERARTLAESLNNIAVRDLLTVLPGDEE